MQRRTAFFKLNAVHPGMFRIRLILIPVVNIMTLFFFLPFWMTS